VLLEAEEEEEISSSKKGIAAFVGADLTFDPVALRAASEERPQDLSEGVGQGEVRAGGGAVIERLGATGLWEIVSDLAASPSAPSADAPQPRSPSKKIRIRRYIAFDVHGSRASVTLELFS
jgi:hypothetical protein